MPTYEYQCNCCHLRFEIKRGFGDGHRVTCPQCEGDTRLLFSPVPIVFKGPGFYVTDSVTDSTAREKGKLGGKPQNKDKDDKEQKEEKSEEISSKIV